MSKFFKIIPVYEDYLINENGQVYSKKRDKLLSPNNDRYGYLNVVLCRNKKRKHFLIHRLVAQAFLDNPNNLPCVNHKNGIKTDNRVENLEWCSYSDNMKHAWDSGLCEKTRASIKINCKYAQKARIRHLDENLKELFDDIFKNQLRVKDICQKYNLKQSYVSQIKNKQFLKVALNEYEKSNLFQAWDLYFNSK